MAKTRRVDTGIEERSVGHYRFTVHLGYTPDGKQIRKTTKFETPIGMSQKKADKLAKAEYVNFANRCKGLYNLKENMRFSELVEEYLRLYAKNELKPITAYNHENQINHHFMDYFGNKKLKDITPALISQFFADHKTVTKKGEVKELSPATAKKLYNILQSLFTFAVKQEIIKETPCRNVILPKKKVTVDEERKYMTEEETSQFLDMFKEYSPFGAIILTLLFTGMRSGECLGLRWEDINFKNRKIHICHTLSDVGGKHFLTTPKSKKSIRYVYMNDMLVELLKKHKIEQTKLQLALGSDFKYPEMVFTSATGNYKDRSCLNTQLKRFLKGTGLEFMSLHKLRHTNATLLVNNDIDIKIVSDHLGHSDIGVTANIYADVMDKTRLKTANTIEQVLRKQTPNKHQFRKFG